MRAGRAIRQAARDDAWRCPQCGHGTSHFELPYGSEGYAPAVFHCTADGCECVLDLTAKASG